MVATKGKTRSEWISSRQIVPYPSANNARPIERSYNGERIKVDTEEGEREKEREREREKERKKEREKEGKRNERKRDLICVQRLTFFSRSLSQWT